MLASRSGLVLEDEAELRINGDSCEHVVCQERGESGWKLLGRIGMKVRPSTAGLSKFWHKSLSLLGSRSGQ